ncbi:hypothetical protein [Planotetraspora kaengkrachanensis]|uniref:Uncharacterized protein n=1 Tax=Planotetraspora kaengkrachanensis TaxID=575193 RepID=A0A8J3VA14_9ACTN|nr:hypothetical protein [Planotetraspora kaengkrachanensis]GIG82469.1 hypothetical protein Pka01_55960 [Planotetraspora kaengkrachanensis]
MGGFDLIWLFEDDPKPQHDDLDWPIGLHSFRLKRGATEILFSIDPLAGEAFVSLFVDGEEVAILGNLRRPGRLSINRGTDHEGLTLWFEDESQEPIQIQTKPSIHVTWYLKAPGVW